MSRYHSIFLIRFFIESGGGRYDVLVEKLHFIFEFKASDTPETLEETAKIALRQIDEKQYGAELNKSKRLFKIGIAFFGKNCSIEVSNGENI